MEKAISKTKTRERINSFFERDSFSIEESKKIKRLAMGNKIRLGKLRANLCKKCYSKLKGKTRTSKTHKVVYCEKCGFLNKIRI